MAAAPQGPRCLPAEGVLESLSAKKKSATPTAAFKAPSSGHPGPRRCSCIHTHAQRKHGKHLLSTVPKNLQLWHGTKFFSNSLST
jgi:hypothetical protein